jgi:hypothetical protein
MVASSQSTGTFSKEGENIKDSKRADLRNLGKLVGKTQTAVADTWGLQYQ